jgi:hypothetical protein
MPHITVRQPDVKFNWRITADFSMSNLTRLRAADRDVHCQFGTAKRDNAHEQQTVDQLLFCSNCGLSGTARLSQPEKRAFDFSVEAIPAGFKVAQLEFGDAFFCEACNLPADTRQPKSSVRNAR